jgi:hypothetical protein
MVDPSGEIAPSYAPRSTVTVRSAAATQLAAAPRDVEESGSEQAGRSRAEADAD